MNKAPIVRCTYICPDLTVTVINEDGSEYDLVIGCPDLRTATAVVEGLAENLDMELLAKLSYRQ